MNHSLVKVHSLTMNKVYARYFTLAFLCLLNSVTGNELRFKHIDSSDGLSHNWVRCFYEDDTGFIWIGTNDGMDRYDGREIKRYQPLIGSSDRKQNVTINSIIKKSNHELWVGSDTGAYIFNQQSGQFHLFDRIGSRPVLHIAKESNGDIWFATDKGLFLLKKKTDEIMHFFSIKGDNPSVADNYINWVFEDSRRQIWVASKAGLSLFDRENVCFTTYRKSLKLGGLPDGDILCIGEDQQGRIWLALQKGGLIMTTFSKKGSLVFKRVSKGKAIRLLVDRENILWVTKTAEGGLDRIDLNLFDEQSGHQLLIDEYRVDLANPWSLSDHSSFCVFEDRMGDIWVGTYGGGVNYYSKRNKRFKTVRTGVDNRKTVSGNKITSFLEDGDDFWIGTISGLERRNKLTGIHTRYRYDPEDNASIGGDPIYSIYKDSRGNLWVSGWTTGLNRFNYETETFDRFMPSEDSHSIGSTTIFKIMEDRDGTLWLATNGGGLNCYNYDTGEFKRYLHFAKDPDSIAFDYVNDILETSRGELYLSAHISLELFDKKTGGFEHFQHTIDCDNGNGGGKILVLFEDSRGSIWLGTTAGLELFDPESGTFETITTQDGLPSNSIQGILEDDIGNLWISTSNGLSVYEGAVYDLENARFRNNSESEGLSSNQFNKRATYHGDDGTFYFGSGKGYTYFKPEEIKYNDVVPKVVLTELLLLESSPDAISSYQSIGRDVNSVNEVTLEHSKSSFVLKFAAMNYLNSEKNHYRYKLKGFDKDWVDAGFKGSVTYTYIPPGDYEFYVVGSNNDGVWSENAATLKISILPPWWETLWFRILMVLIIVFILITFYRVRFSILQKHKRVLEERVHQRTEELENAYLRLKKKRRQIEVQNEELKTHREHLETMIQMRTRELEKAKIKAEESDQLKSSFLMNMSHEIRTPMNAILCFSSLLKDPEIDQKDRDEFVDIIGTNGQSLLVIIDDILDVSMIQADQIRLSVESFSLDKVLQELWNHYNMMNEKDLTITLVHQKEFECLRLITDQVRLRQLLNNLLGNAYKYTDSGEISFGARVENESVLFEVTDTGLGIDTVDIEKVFDHFYKVEKNNIKLYPGTGIGLSICRKLVKKMGGEIWVESELGKGSSFYFTLPLVHGMPSNYSGNN